MRSCKRRCSCPWPVRRRGVRCSQEPHGPAAIPRVYGQQDLPRTATDPGGSWPRACGQQLSTRCGHASGFSTAMGRRCAKRLISGPPLRGCPKNGQSVAGRMKRGFQTFVTSLPTRLPTAPVGCSGWPAAPRSPRTTLWTILDQRSPPHAGGILGSTSRPDHEARPPGGKTGSRVPESGSRPQVGSRWIGGSQPGCNGSAAGRGLPSEAGQAPVGVRPDTLRNVRRQKWCARLAPPGARSATGPAEARQSAPGQSSGARP